MLQINLQKPLVRNSLLEHSKLKEEDLTVVPINSTPQTSTNRMGLGTAANVQMNQNSNGITQIDVKSVE